MKTLINLLLMSAILYGEGVGKYKLLKMPENRNVEPYIKYNDVNMDINATSPKLKLVEYKHIRFSKHLNKYSVLLHNKEGFKRFLKKKDIPIYALKQLFGRYNNFISLLVSAYGYDWVYKRPDLAENFYRLIIKQHTRNLNTKIKVADYFLRTERVEKIHDILTKADCMQAFSLRGLCMYYYALPDYLLEGKNRTVYMSIAAEHGIKLAKKIYWNDPKKK